MAPLDRDDGDPGEEDARAGEEPGLGFVDSIQLLISSGHRLEDIFERRQIGYPYFGWSIPQFYTYLEAAIQHVNRLQATVIDTLQASIASVFDGKEQKAMKEVASLKKKLRNWRMPQWPTA